MAFIDNYYSISVKKVLTEQEAAEYIGMSQSFLRQDRMNGVRSNRTPGPVFTKIGRAVRYLKDDLDDWLITHRVERDHESSPVIPGGGA